MKKTHPCRACETQADGVHKRALASTCGGKGVAKLSVQEMVFSSATRRALLTVWPEDEVQSWAGHYLDVLVGLQKLKQIR